jgi:AcrR family transcriptional regulator
MSPNKTPRTQAQRTEETRHKLVEAAEHVFVQVGFEAATIDEIVKKAGYTRGAFYCNFKSKEQLFIATVSRVLGRLSREFDQLTRTYLDPRERLAALQKFYARIANEELSGALLLIEFKLYAVRHPKRHLRLSTTYSQIRQSREHLLEKTASELGLRLPLHPNLLETALAALLTGLLLDRAFYFTHFQPAPAEVESLMNLFFDRIISHNNGFSRDDSTLPQPGRTSSLVAAR